MEQTTYRKVQDNSRKKYILKSSPETDMKALMESAEARQLSDLLKSTNPKRFSAMMQDKSLPSYLNGLVENYQVKMEVHLQNGWQEIEAKEVEWWNLTVMAGIENQPLRELPEFPPQ